MDESLTIVDQLQATGKVSLPPTGWQFEKRADNMFEIIQTDFDGEENPSIHVTRDPVFAPGNLVGNYDPGETVHKSDNFEYPTTEPEEFAKWLNMKINLTSN